VSRASARAHSGEGVSVTATLPVGQLLEAVDCQASSREATLTQTLSSSVAVAVAVVTAAVRWAKAAPVALVEEHKARLRKPWKWVCGHLYLDGWHSDGRWRRHLVWRCWLGPGRRCCGRWWISGWWRRWRVLWRWRRSRLRRSPAQRRGWGEWLCAPKHHISLDHGFRHGSCDNPPIERQLSLPDWCGPGRSGEHEKAAMVWSWWTAAARQEYSHGATPAASRHGLCRHEWVTARQRFASRRPLSTSSDDHWPRV
jgi:hypothetical protein